MREHNGNAPRKIRKQKGSMGESKLILEAAHWGTSAAPFWPIKAPVVLSRETHHTKTTSNPSFPLAVCFWRITLHNESLIPIPTVIPRYVYQLSITQPF